MREQAEHLRRPQRGPHLLGGVLDGARQDVDRALDAHRRNERPPIRLRERQTVKDALTKGLQGEF